MSVAREIIKNKWLYLMALPGFVFVFIFFYLPMPAHLIAFQNYNPVKGILGSEFVGLNNIKFFFMSDDWKRVLRNTVFLNTLFLVIDTIVAVTLAIFFNEIRKGLFRKVSQSIVVLPNLISYTVVGLLAKEMFSYDFGLLNKIIKTFGGEPVVWFSRPEIWPYLLTFIVVWKTAGWKSIIYLATISGISSEIYESARVDGATRIQQIRHITIPILTPTIIFLTLLALGKIFNGDFGLIYNITNDSSMLYKTTDVIDTYTYRALRSAGDYSMAASVALFQSVLGLISIVFFNWLTGKYNKDYKIF